MIQYELQVCQITVAPQKRRAFVFNPGVDGRFAPELDDIHGRTVLERVASSNQALRDPGAAHLVFLAKLASASGTDHGNVGKILSQVLGNSDVVSQAGKKSGLAL